MTKIHQLSDELISQIAAGEVIERPASAIKELVENSIDAGSTQISVEVEDGGLKKLRVVDNGMGLSFSEAPLAFSRHATSKLQKVEDLFNILSLGFRGEALASIASIAEVELLSREKGSRVGVHYLVDGGKLITHEESSCPEGTDISIRGLFKHTPARRKYMKTEKTEYGHILTMVSNLALAHPNTAFRLKRDGSEVFDLPVQSMKERVRSLYGGQTSQALIPVQFHQTNLLIDGFVGKPELARSGRKYQFIFLNGRSIDSRLINHAVKEAFHSLLMHEKYPWFLLNINIDPQFVDVNVHPRKLEVKFVNQQEVYRAVRGAVHHALQGQMLSPVISVSSESQSTQLNFKPMLRTPMASRSFSPSSIAGVPEFKPADTFTVNGTELRPVAQVANCYIVAESEEGMVLIDQHAAHERVRYAQLMDALEKAKPLKQVLLTPLEMDLGVEAAKLVEEHRPDFYAMGFEIEPFGGNTFLLRAVPAGLEKRNPEQLVRDILTDVTEEWKQDHTKNLREFLLTYTACRGAIKFGDQLTLPEMQALIRDMEKTKHCTHCPHGRPAIVTLTFDSLETMFKRKNF
ncbi:MAG: DNA mismatch repair protein MutL [Oceanicoccus sp.]|jgi:DNA mismatch repair protein MutL